jgi:hypothetical protein
VVYGTVLVSKRRSERLLALCRECLLNRIRFLESSPCFMSGLGFFFCMEREMARRVQQLSSDNRITMQTW